MILPRTPGSMIKFFPVNSEIARITSPISTFGKSKDSIVSGKFSFVISSEPDLLKVFFWDFVKGPDSFSAGFAAPRPDPPVKSPPMSPSISGGGGGGGKSSN
ncbi:hypothetical protein D3C72_1849850 [compost metagenome]